jgi:dihydrofolate reductase
MALLTSSGGREATSCWGGPTVAAAAIEAGLVDECHFDIHPAIAGRGKRLFANVARAQRLRHLGTDTHPSGVITVKYASA